MYFWQLMMTFLPLIIYICIVHVWTNPFKEITFSYLWCILTSLIIQISYGHFDERFHVIKFCSSIMIQKKYRLSQISHKTISVMSISFIFIFAILIKYLLVICTYFSKCWILLDEGQTSWKLAVFHRVEQLSMISRKLEFTCTKKLFFMKQWFQLSKIFKCFLSHGEELDWVLTARMLSRSRMGRPLSMYRMSSSGRFHSDTWLLRVLGPRCMWTGINVLGDFCSRWSADKTVNKKNKNIDNDIFSIKMSHSKNHNKVLVVCLVTVARFWCVKWKRMTSIILRITADVTASRSWYDGAKKNKNQQK